MYIHAEMHKQLLTHATTQLIIHAYAHPYSYLFIPNCTHAYSSAPLPSPDLISNCGRHIYQALQDISSAPSPQFNPRYIFSAPYLPSLTSLQTSLDPLFPGKSQRWIIHQQALLPSQQVVGSHQQLSNNITGFIQGKQDNASNLKKIFYKILAKFHKKYLFRTCSLQVFYITNWAFLKKLCLQLRRMQTRVLSLFCRNASIQLVVIMPDLSPLQAFLLLNALFC